MVSGCEPDEPERSEEERRKGLVCQNLEELFIPFLNLTFHLYFNSYHSHFTFFPYFFFLLTSSLTHFRGSPPPCTCSQSGPPSFPKTPIPPLSIPSNRQWARQVVSSTIPQTN